jgi:hypothetical protein
LGNSFSAKAAFTKRGGGFLRIQAPLKGIGMSIDQLALAVFEDKQQADLAVCELNRFGFLPEQIAVARQLTSEEKRESDAAKEQGKGAVASLAIFFATCSDWAVKGAASTKQTSKPGARSCGSKPAKVPRKQWKSRCPFWGERTRSG